MAKLYIGNLSYKVDDDMLNKHFSACGQITDSVVMKDRETGGSRGFGFVTYSSEQEAQNAIRDLHDQELDGRRLRVNMANPKGGSGGFFLLFFIVVLSAHTRSPGGSYSGGGGGYGGGGGGYGGGGGGGYDNSSSSAHILPMPIIDALLQVAAAAAGVKGLSGERSEEMQSL
ncbi:hypothetical protein C8F04DRAFT_1392061 [Mycena alexandri]|uniref:RRM domain-containing protein n=1 Tax=Mycena alexandri TaxID=1745969 RepID=A0AAD6XC24_9AGAR|nr:hypothetical protein C8F04DRAFT_1392061 [Mycena alexandri]